MNGIKHIVHSGSLKLVSFIKVRIPTTNSLISLFKSGKHVHTARSVIVVYTTKASLFTKTLNKLI